MVLLIFLFCALFRFKRRFWNTLSFIVLFTENDKDNLQKKVNLPIDQADDSERKEILDRDTEESVAG